MINSKHYNIGVLIGNVHTYHPQELIRGIQEAAKNRNVDIFFFLGTQSGLSGKKIGSGLQVEEYNYQYNTVYDYSLLADLDAMIIAYGTLCSFLENENKEDFFKRYETIPHIVLEEREKSENASYLISDNYNGMKRIMNHLIEEHGYQKIALLSGPKDNSDALERKTAYLDAMNMHNLEVDDFMIAYGNYTEFVDLQVEFLLDNNPGLEAICCANDEMAIGVYKIMEKRGIRPGEDIAVTGYDDFQIAQSLYPPLTTADQNGFDMGYRALIHAIQLCTEKKSVTIRYPAKLIIRNSCGCKLSRNYLYYKCEQEPTKESLIIISDRIAEAVALNKENQESLQYLKERFYFITESIYENFVSDQNRDLRDMGTAQTVVFNCLKELMTGPYSKCISSLALTGNISYFIQEMMSFVDTKRQSMLLQGLRIQIEEFIHSFVIVENDREFIEFQRKTWLSPIFARVLMETVKDEKQFYYRVVSELHNLNVSNAYVYLLKQPLCHESKNIWTCPDEVYLAAYSEDEKIEAYEPNNRPIASKQRGFSHYINHETNHEINHKLVVFTLSAEQLQYGVLMCEMDQDNLPALYLLSLQLGTAIRFLNLSKAEHIAKKELQVSLQMIEEKNEVLNFISSYDELTGLLNRRGFMEKAIIMNRQNEGKKACIVFCDLDHLKEINDFYGHAEGDFAIIKIGSYLRDIFGENSLIGRIGGDENVVFVLEDSLSEEYKRLIHNGCSMGKLIQNEMKKKNKIYNDLNEKPYYIECSVGVQEFICSKDSDISRLLNLADNSLYEQKKFRRTTIKRDQ